MISGSLHRVDGPSSLYAGGISLQACWPGLPSAPSNLLMPQAAATRLSQSCCQEAIRSTCKYKCLASYRSPFSRKALASASIGRQSGISVESNRDGVHLGTNRVNVRHTLDQSPRAGC